MKPHRFYQKGFSLVELSIVLVILGLLVGGIMTGQNLIKAAELRAVTTEFQQWQTAVNLFKDKYFALPGDMRNAHDFWDDGADGVCGTAAECNGNGNGLIAVNSDGAQHNEYYRFWQHLALAGLITGDYTGVAGIGGSVHHVIGENTPPARFNNGGWSVETIYGGDTIVRYDLDYENAFILGQGTSDDTTFDPLLTPEEAWNIDTKMDDGKPGRGNVIGIFWDDTCGNATANTDYDADYRLSDDTVQCAFYFLNAM